MGRFSGSCAITHFGIRPDDKCLKLTMKERWGTYDLMCEFSELQRLQKTFVMNKCHTQRAEFSGFIKEISNSYGPFVYVGYGLYDDYGRLEDCQFEIGEDDDDLPYMFIKQEAFEHIIGYSASQKHIQKDLTTIFRWCLENRIQLSDTMLLGAQSVTEDDLVEKGAYISLLSEMLEKEKNRRQDNV